MIFPWDPNLVTYSNSSVAWRRHETYSELLCGGSKRPDDMKIILQRLYPYLSQSEATSILQQAFAELRAAGSSPNGGWLDYDQRGELLRVACPTVPPEPTCCLCHLKRSEWGDLSPTKYALFWKDWKRHRASLHPILINVCWPCLYRQRRELNCLLKGRKTLHQIRQYLRNEQPVLALRQSRRKESVPDTTLQA